MRIKIDAIDTLFFKDGRPFSMGDESWASGLFPPPPSVFYGSLRTAYFSRRPQEISKANKNDDPTSNLKINFIGMYAEKDLFFPAPADLVKKSLAKKDGDKQLYKVSLADKPQIGNYYHEKFLKWNGEEVVERPEKYFLIRAGKLKEYLSDKYDYLTYRELDEFVVDEPKVGIGRKNSSRSAKDGMLYQVSMKRTENKDKLSFVLDYEGLDLNNTGILKLGGEAKAAAYEELNIDLKEELAPPKIEGKILKLYLITPSVFKQGSLPDLSAEKFRKHNMKLIAAAVAGYKHIGGFNMAEKKPKPMYRAVKEGAVYYFSFDGNPEDVVADFHLKSISDFDFGKQGFGITLVGNVK
jgi:CRISPR-associated protein Cmr3